MTTYVYRCPKGHESTAYGAWIDKQTGQSSPPDSTVCQHEEPDGSKCPEQAELIGEPLDRERMRMLRNNMAQTFDEMRHYIGASQSGILGSINAHNLLQWRDMIWKNGKELQRLAKSYPDDEELKAALELYAEYCKADNVGEPPQ